MDGLIVIDPLLGSNNIPTGLLQSEINLRDKADLIIAGFGSELLFTPLDQLRAMAAQPCDPEDGGNVFFRIWEAHHFLPSGRWLRSLGGSDSSELHAIAEVMVAVWGDEN